MGRLQGKVAVVTGGNSGIGLATARRFAHEGAHLFIAGRRKPELDAALHAIGGNTVIVQADISNLADLDRLYDTVRQKAGAVDVLFANAGGGTFSPLQDVTEAHYDGIFAANVKGTLFTARRRLGDLLAAGCLIWRRGVSGSTFLCLARHRRPAGTDLRHQKSRTGKCSARRLPQRLQAGSATRTKLHGPPFF